MMSFLANIFNKKHEPETTTTRPYKLYDAESFFEQYKYGMISSAVGEAVMERRTDACIDGKKKFIVYDDEMDVILKNMHEYLEFERKLGAAVDNNNDGIALEKAGDIAGAIEKFEQNILPDTYFTLHPYRRLCVLYRRAGDYDNEIRVIETCLARPEWKGQQYNESKELAFFEDRLVKAKKYREQHQQK